MRTLSHTHRHTHTHTQRHTSSFTPLSACHCSVHVKGAICPTPHCLIPNSTNKDTVGLPTLFGMASDPSYNPKASLFDELGMRLKNPLFLQTAPLMFDYCYKTLNVDVILVTK